MTAAANGEPASWVERWRALGADGLESIGGDGEVVVLSNGALGVVVLDRPPVNALTLRTYHGLAAGFRQLTSSAATQCVIFTAGGDRAFCAGADVKERSDLGANPPARAQREVAVASLYGALGAVAAPVVVAIDGPCLGAGAVLASLADIRIATRKAWFALPEVDIGAVGGGRHLARVLPTGIVRELALTGRRLDVEEAHRLGFVNRIAADAHVLECAMECASALLDKDPRTLLAVKDALARGEGLGLADGFALEQAASFRLGMFNALERPWSE